MTYHISEKAPTMNASGAAVLFGNSGGVMEAAVRTVYEVLSGKELPAVKLDAVRGLKGVKAATLSLPLQGGRGKSSFSGGQTLDRAERLDLLNTTGMFEL